MSLSRTAHCKRFLIQFDFKFQSNILITVLYRNKQEKKSLYYYRMTRCYQLIVYIDSFMTPGSVYGANIHIPYTIQKWVSIEIVYVKIS